MSGCLFIDEDAPTVVHVPMFDEILQQPIGLGKYKHKTLQWVIHYDLNYIKWMLVSLPSQGRHMLRNRYNTLDFTALELRYREESDRQINTVFVEHFVQFKHKNKLCQGRIVGIEPPEDSVLSHTKVRVVFDYSPNACTFLKSTTRDYLYQDLLIRHNELDPPSLVDLYVLYNIDIDTLKPVPSHLVV